MCAKLAPKRTQQTFSSFSYKSIYGENYLQHDIIEAFISWQIMD